MISAVFSPALWALFFFLEKPAGLWPAFGQERDWAPWHLDQRKLRALDAQDGVGCLELSWIGPFGKKLSQAMVSQFDKFGGRTFSQNGV